MGPAGRRKVLGLGHSSPRARAARKAVMTLLAHSNSTFAKSSSPLDAAPSNRATIAARSPTTVACTCRAEIRNVRKGPLISCFSHSLNIL